MHPIIKPSRTPEGLGRWGIRGIDKFTVEELTRLHQKLDGWIHQRAHDPERPRRRPWLVMKPRPSIRPEERGRRVIPPRPQKGDNMISSIIVVAIIAGAGWMAWSRWRDWRTPLATRPSAAMSPEPLAFEAFTHGNTCLAEGKFADATAAFERARELDPKRLHVADRLAEVARRQAAASPPPAAAAF